MVRRIIEIDREKCNGCGACAAACHEGAIGMAATRRIWTDPCQPGYGTIRSPVCSSFAYRCDRAQQVQAEIVFLSGGSRHIYGFLK